MMATAKDSATFFMHGNITVAYCKFLVQNPPAVLFVGTGDDLRKYTVIGIKHDQVDESYIRIIEVEPFSDDSK